MARSNIIRVSVLGETKDLAKKLSKAESDIGKLNKLSSGAGGILGGSLKGAAAGVGVAGAALVGLGITSTKAASEAEQSLGATESIFGKFADSVVSASEGAAKGLGLSANEYRENSNLLGALLKNQGVAADELAGKTGDLIGVGADLAATFGGETSDAVAALSSAFKGEFDPLEKYGISLKASSVNAYLAANGQDHLTGAALDAAKQQALTALIMEQSADAQGMFGRESETLAGQQQRLGAQFEDVKAKIGEALLPILTELTIWLNEQGIPLFEAFSQDVLAHLPGFIEGVRAKFEEWWPTIQKVTGFLWENKGTIGALVAAFYAVVTVLALINPIMSAFKLIMGAIRVATVAWSIAQGILNVVLSLNPIMLVVLAIVALVAIFVLAYQKSDRFRAMVDKVWTAVKDLAAKLWEWFSDLPEKIAGFVSGAKDWLKNVGTDIIQGLINGIKAGAGVLKDAVVGVVGDNVPGPVRRLLGINSPSRLFKSYGRYTAQGLALGMTGEAGLLRGAAGDMAREVAAGFSAPRLALNTRPSQALAGMGRTGTGNTYKIDVKVPVGASAAEVGRELVAYIDAFEGNNGRRFATA